MKIRSNSLASVVALAMAVAAPLAALADGMPSAPGSQKGRHAQKKSHPKGHPAPMIAVMQKANSSGVTLQYRLDAVPQVGRAVPVVLEFDGVTDPNGASVRFSADAGLTLRGADALTLPAGQRSSATVFVTSEQEGLAYLNVFIGQNERSSAVSIPIQTGSAVPAMKPSGELQSTPGGGDIITMPAK